MSLKLTSLTPSDVDAWARLDYAAFRDNIGRVLWTRDPSENTFSLMAEARIKDLQEPDSHHHKIVDVDHDPEAPIAFASWHIFPKPRSLEEVNAGFQIPDLYPERNLDAVITFFQTLFEVHRDIMGAKPHIYLDMLATHPDHQRKGAGRLLVEWAAEKGDEMGLGGFIEASAQGLPLYAKFGYEPVREVIFNDAPFEGQVITACLGLSSLRKLLNVP